MNQTSDREKKWNKGRVSLDLDPAEPVEAAVFSVVVGK